MKRASLGLLLVSLIAVPLHQKQETDREFAGLKGRLKTVTEERAEVTKSDGKSVEAARLRHKILTFDTDGNLVTDEAFQKGQAFDIRTYGVIDGERVVKHDVLNMSLIGGIGSGQGPGRPHDPRYSAKLKYKYDSQGRRIEMAWVRPDNELYLRYVYKLDGNRRTTSVYRENGSFSHGWEDVLDDKGNAIETKNILAPGNGEPPLKSTYTYLEFDPHGNWTKRLEVRGNFTYVSYRSLTYY